MKPLAIDLFAGLGGWSTGLLAEGYDCVGFDIEEHVYGEHRYPAQLVVQDVLTLHGSQFKSADLIVASPPCQKYSYMAMPWKRAKAKAAAIRADTSGKMLADLNRLFDACFRIQREASFAAKRHIPLVVENVRGAQPWVGRARWMYGSFALWGDVPALMPHVTNRRMKFPADCGPRMWSEREYVRLNDGNVSAFHHEGATKTRGLVQMRDGHTHTRHLTNQAEHIKCGGDWFDGESPSDMRHFGSKPIGRKAASAMIAKIPLPLSRHIAATFRPQ